MKVAAQVYRIQEKIADAAKSCQRDPNSIQLLAVSKGQPAGIIREAFAAGLDHFGENYLQEAQTKMHSLTDLPIVWHFIGPIQSNKAQAIAHQFSWVHTLSRENIAELLAKYRLEAQLPLNVCLQVNLDEEESKSGLLPHQVAKFAVFVKQLPRLRLRGLMALPKLYENEQKQYESLIRLTILFNQLNKELSLSMDTLSMGMSNDLIAAIHSGSTILRIGQAIFGKRVPK